MKSNIENVSSTQTKKIWETPRFEIISEKGDGVIAKFPIVSEAVSTAPFS